ncbi:ABC transporter substrate-binding protein [Streptomyces sp. TRM66268-LWL]|uniref:ABC transporter substrate-binding protein n=1 Tax=Streptomyces polyasparticus TaxID=2767826 RepID=A0ABR7SLT5_9ACTN|nr:ABC transporter substrate-binding protein [Streptomyces polyasparticus]MBC9715466.1 ABC transporter substrate-binding protein [Streptomyces polyasparticus]
MNIRKSWPAPILAAGLAAGLLSGCGTEQGAGGGEDGEIVVGMSDDVLATDPASGYDPGSWLLFNNVFQSLLSFPKGGTDPEPEAAESCTFTDSATKELTCKLRDGLKFSNGNDLTSKDVKYSFDRTVKIDDPDGPAVMFSSLDKITTPDARTVVFHLKTPDATFPSKIASGAGSIVDHREYPADKLRKDGKAVGSGPYTLDAFGKNEAAFKVNGSYKGNAETQNSGVTLRFFHNDRKKLKQAMLAGDIDIAYRGLSAGDIADLNNSTSSEQRAEVIEGSSAEVQHIVLNMNDPVVGKLGVRKALAYLIDRQKLVSEVHDQTASPLYSIVPAGIEGHNTAFFDTYGGTPQPDKAEQALRAEGITDKVELTLWATPSRYGPATVEEFEAIAKQLNDSGLFQATVKSVEFEQYEKDVEAGKYGFYVKGWVPDYPDPENFTQPFFGKGNVLMNDYTNETITGEIIPGTAAQTDRTETQDQFHRLQDIVAEEIPIIPLWQGKQYAVVGEEISGVEWCLDASTVFRFWELHKG